MSLIEFVALVVIAGVTGVIAQALVGYTSGGVLASIGIGFTGALVGPWLAAKLSLPMFAVIDIGGHGFPIVWSIIGSVVLVGAFALLSRRRKPARA